jgi:hypothetical protein
MTGGGGWTLSDIAAPGANTCGMKAGLDDADDLYDVIIKKTSGNQLAGNMAPSASQQWGIQLLAPTSFSDGGTKSGTITLTATQA